MYHHLKNKTRNQPFLAIVDAIGETLADNDISQIVKNNLQRTLAWFRVDYFVHYSDLFLTARKSFRPQTSDDEIILADPADHVWDPEWSHLLFFKIPTDFKRATLPLSPCTKII